MRSKFDQQNVTLFLFDLMHFTELSFRRWWNFFFYLNIEIFLNVYDFGAQSTSGKILTFHVARHTFATTVTMMNGVPIESVSRMLGHKDIKSTQHYARIVDTKIGNDMMDLANRIGSRLSFPAGYK
jgi:integrase